MKKISSLSMLLALVFIMMSCKDTKREEAELDKTLDKIEAVEKKIDATVDDVEKKAEEVEDVLKELDNI